MAEWKRNGSEMTGRKRKEAPENWLIGNLGDQLLEVQNCNLQTWALVTLAGIFYLYPTRLLPLRFLNGRGFPVGISIPM